MNIKINDAERVRLPLGLVRFGIAHHREILLGLAVVRGGHCAFNQPRQRTQTADGLCRSWRKTTVLGRHVNRTLVTSLN